MRNFCGKTASSIPCRPPHPPPPRAFRPALDPAVLPRGLGKCLDAAGGVLGKFPLLARHRHVLLARLDDEAAVLDANVLVPIGVKLSLAVAKHARFELPF